MLAAFSLAGALCAAEDAASSSEVIPLEPLIVVERRVAAPPEARPNWLHGRIGEFEVLSSADGRDSSEYLRRFYGHHLLFAELFPQISAVKFRPVTLVLCGESGSFRALQPSDADEPGKRAVSFHVGDDNSSVLGVDLRASAELAAAATRPARPQRSGLGDELLPGAAPARLDPELQVKRAYVRFMLAQRESRAPAWLEEGLVQLFALAQASEGKLRFGPLSDELVAQVEALPGGGGVPRLGHRACVEALALFFQRHEFLSFEDFFARSWYAGAARRADQGSFAMQSLAFVHYCLHAQDGAKQMAFANFVTQLDREPASEALFTACFGKNYQAFLRDLGTHLRSGRYLAAAAKEFLLPPVPEPVLRAAKPAEWMRVQGDAQRLSGHMEAAARTLQQALEDEHTDARLFAAIGFLLQQRDEQEEALLAFRNAATAKVDLPAPYLALARYRLRASSPDDGDSTLTRKEFVSVMRFVMAAREQMRTPRRELYQIAAEAWIRAPVSPLNQNLELLEEGVMAFPNDTWLMADTAELKRRIGRIEDAHQLAQRGLRIAKDEAVRSRFTNLANETRPSGSLAAH